MNAPDGRDVVGQVLPDGLIGFLFGAEFTCLQCCGTGALARFRDPRRYTPVMVGDDLSADKVNDCAECMTPARYVRP